MCTREQAIKIVDQVDLINHAKNKFEALDMLILMAAESGNKIDCTGEEIGKLGQLLKHAIMDPIFEAADKIYKIIREEKHGNN